MRRVLFLLMLGVAVLPAAEAHAIPAFARQVGVNCNVCHRAYPELKPFGAEFAANGFRLGEALPGERIEDEMLSLLESFPLAIRLQGDIVSRPKDRAQADFQVPIVAKLLSGGAVSEYVAYYMYFLMAERGRVAGLEDAWVSIHDAPIENLGLQLGQFQLADLAFPRELRLTRQDYLIYTVPQSESGFNMTYQRGAFLSYDFSRLSAVAGVANGNGLDTAPEGPAYPGRHNARFDNDTAKIGFGRLALGLDELTIGTLGVYGVEGREATGNRLWRAGVDLNWYWDKLRLFGQAMAGTDDNPAFELRAGDPEQALLRGGFAGLSYLLTDRWVTAALYNRVISDRHEIDANLYTLSFSYYWMRNFKMGVEGTYDALYESDDHPFPEHAITAFIDLAY